MTEILKKIVIYLWFGGCGRLDMTKNIKLREARGISFEDIEETILNDRLHRIEKHPDQEKKPSTLEP